MDNNKINEDSNKINKDENETTNVNNAAPILTSKEIKKEQIEVNKFY